MMWYFVLLASNRDCKILRSNSTDDRSPLGQTLKYLWLQLLNHNYEEFDKAALDLHLLRHAYH